MRREDFLWPEYFRHWNKRNENHNLWKQAHGYPLDSEKTAQGGNENPAWNVGHPVDTGDIFLGGLRKNGPYAIPPSSPKRCVPVSAWHSNHPVNAKRTVFNFQDACLPNTDGQVMGLLHFGSGAPEILLSGDLFVVAWEQETDSAFQPFINRDFQRIAWAA
ncbi:MULTISPECIES: hypothetical protein [unclassified Akkermansia]|uniref:hypothetical protein n=1 Tax=unclassified Akkermansia TaxID=2608915 RepID=UPI0010E3D8E3|nr:hypothetical protein [Akkermansia sp. BIOML-A12]RYT95969.1 hypothetical protein EAJ17_09975 [Akkermansia sp. aa_0143]